ncbi:MAG: dipeptidase [Candidatus Hinthialibacter antarcticus]|nr:dipeptidase [Candidatus Hinthialibacter antarcticus]
MQAILDYIEQNRQRFVDELVEWVKIPSVSAQSARKADCGRAAQYVESQLNSIGFETRLCPTAGNPVVLGKHHKAPGKPTVLIYGHYDVQPEDPVDLWQTPPFDPQVRDGNLYARGATDNKGQCFAHIKAVEALIQSNGELPVNITFLIEGEEEIHSANLYDFILKNKDELKCDVGVISDSSQFGPGMPAVTYGLRGIVGEEIRVTGPKQDLHSGVYGGAVANPCNVIADIISKLKDQAGRVAIPGFYDDVLELEPWEREAFAKLPFDAKAFNDSIGVPEASGEQGYNVYEQRWARPTLDVNGIFGGYQGEGSKTIVPSWAGAKITMRMVPNQDPEKIHQQFVDYVKSIAPPSVQVTFKDGGGCGAVMVPRDARFMDQAIEAVKRGFGAEPVFIREGGSIPIVLTLSEELGVHVLLLGFGLPDDNMHGPNEKFSLDDFIKGIKTSAWLLHLCGEAK